MVKRLFVGGVLFALVMTAAISFAGWSTGVIDNSNGPIEYTALAEVNGQPAVAYYNYSQDARRMYYLAFDGQFWQQTPLYSGSQLIANSVSLAVLDGQPIVAYAKENQSNDTVYYERLESQSWNRESVASGNMPALAVVNGQPAISFVNGNNELIYTRYTGEDWENQVVTTGGSNGFANDIAEVNGQPGIAYHHAGVKYAAYNGQQWVVTTIDSGNGDNIGRFLSLAVINGQPAVSYFDRDNDQLKYARYNGATWDVTAVTPAMINSNTSLAEIGGQPAIAYYDDTYNDEALRYARFNGSTWDIIDVDPFDSTYGGYPSLTVINGKPAVSYVALDGGGSNEYLKLKYAVLSADLNAVTLTSPGSTAIAAETVTLTWDEQPDAESYVIDVYDAYVQIYDGTVQKSACNEGVCSLELPINSVVGDYDVWIQAQGNGQSGPWALSEFTVQLGETQLTAPTGQISATNEITLTFPEVAGATYYVLDVYRPFSDQRVIVESSACSEGTCTTTISANNEQGDFNVWIIAGVGPYFGSWTSSTFTLGLPSVTLTASGLLAPAPTVTLTFERPAEAAYVVLDVYDPFGVFVEAEDRYVVEMNTCTTTCTVDVTVDYVTGTYVVWAIAGVGDTFGGWAFSEFTVGFPAVTLTQPLGTVPLAASFDFAFNLPAGAGYVVIDVYRPDGSPSERFLVEAADCPGRACTLNVPANGAVGTWNVWSIPGVGTNFGEWAYSTFTVNPPDITAAEVDLLGSAVEAPRLDTSAVEAAVEGAGF